LKNRAFTCDDYKEPDDDVRRTCTTCRYQSQGGGAARDAAHYKRLEELSTNAAALGTGGGTGQLEEYRSFVGTTKALEVAQAYYAGKLVYKRPDYLPICTHPSYMTDTDFVPCCMQNPHDTCAEWEPRAPVPDVARMSYTEALELLQRGAARPAAPSA